MPEGARNDAKMDAKIMIFFNFLGTADFSKITVLLWELFAF